MTVDASGVEENVVVKNPSALDEIKDLSLPVVTSSADTYGTDRSGNVTVKDHKGAAFAAVPAMRMWDASLDPQTGEPHEHPLVATISKRKASGGKGGFNLVLRPDATWLNDPDRVFPITLDPSINASDTFDTYVKQGSSTDYSGDNDLQFGVTSGAVTRSFLSWDVSKMEHAVINSATVYFYAYYSQSCTAAQWDLYYDAAAATASTTWATQPAGTTLESSSTATKGYSSSCDDGWITIDGKNFFQAAANTGSSRGYMQLRAHDESATSIGFKQVRSRNASDPSQVPYAVVNYTSTPVISGRTTSPATPCVTGSTRPYISSMTPMLSTKVTQGDAATSTVTFDWAVVGGADLGTHADASVASGSTASATVPTGTFTQGNSYEWRVKAASGSATSAWSSWCEFTIDTVAPSVPPIVTSADYPAGAWSGATGVSGTFNFAANGVSDIGSYLYGLDTPSPTNSVTASVASADVTPESNGPHTLYAQSVDRAGNKSAVTSYSFDVGGAAVVSPASGSTNAGLTILQGAAPTGATAVTFEYRRATTDSWTVIPPPDVTYATGGSAIGSWPVSVSGSTTPKLNWNLKATLGGTFATAGPVMVEAVFTGGVGGTSPENDLTFDPNLASGASATVGPGSVNLVSGNFTVSDTDVSVTSYGSDLTTTRTFNSRQAGTFDTTHMFGPGWVSSAVVESANSPYTSLTVSGSLVQVGVPDGSTIGFTQKSASTFTPEIGYETLTLTYASGAYTLSDQGGNVVVFTHVSGAPAGQYSPTTVTQPGDNQSTTLTWQTTTVDGVTVTRPVQMLAPIPEGVSSCTTLVAGCRALTFTYAATTTATGTGQAAWGGYTGRVSQISFTAWDPATSAMTTIAVAAFLYDSSGRLVAAWDPRLDDGPIHLWATYSYNVDGTLATIADDTKPAWSLTYTTIPGDSGAGRLSSAAQSALAAGIATTTVVYDVPLTTTAGGPYDMDAATVAAWDELDPPIQATAIFDARQVPSGNQATGTMPSAWTKATVHYLDADSREVNTVTPGGNVSTTWYDKYGNVTQSLTPNDLLEAFDWGMQNWFNMDSPQLADALSTVNTYSADGTQEVSTAGPFHSMTLSDGIYVVGRNVTTYTYDEGAPADTCPCGLQTTQRDSVTYWDGGVPDSGTEITDADDKSTTTAYDWDLRQPVTSTVDPGGLNLATTTTYDPTTGLVTSVTTPAGGSSTNTPATTITVYYSAAANPTYPECGQHPEWANLVCMTGPGGQADSGPELPFTETTYDMFCQPLTQTESTSAGVLRTTAFTYDRDERTISTSIVGVADTGTPVPASRNVYDPATGNLIHVQSLDASNNVTAETTTAYDLLGRVTSYTDSDGNESATTYNLLGQPTAESDGLQTTTTSYDTGGENRGLATEVVDAQAGTITATYDADGNLAQENWPNGIVVTYGYDEAGELYEISYSDPGCGEDDCTVDDEQAYYGQGGNIIGTTDSFQNLWYYYDNDNRLYRTLSWDDAGCTTRLYEFNDASDRTELDNYAPAEDGSCLAYTPLTSKSWTYDSADRTINAGYVYDALSRTTTMPAADTQLSAQGDLTITYDANDLVHTLTQGSLAIASYGLDVDNQRIRAWTDGSGVHTDHFAGAGGAPAWVGEGGGATRYVTAFDRLAAVAANDGTVSWQATDVEGNNVTSIDVSGTIQQVTTTDEYGVLQDSTQVGQIRYAWLGTHQLPSDNPGGLSLMGVRIYNPTTDRFLSRDPISGGNANAYVYCAQRTLNCTDLTGQSQCHKFLFIRLCGRIYNDTKIAYLICQNRNSHGITHPFAWLNPGESSTSIWPDTDAIYIWPSNHPHWAIVHDNIGYQDVSAIIQNIWG